MKKLLILTACLILAVSAIGQVGNQKVSYNAAVQFLTDTYATITDISQQDGYMSIYADMPLGYVDYLIKLDTKNFTDDYSDVRLYTPWTYNSQFDTIECTWIVAETEYVVLMYSEELNTIFFFFEWKQ